MAKDEDAVTDKDVADGKETVSKITEKDPTDGLPMHVSDDGVVTFGDADARGEKTGKVGDDDDEEHEDPSLSDPEREALRAKRREEKKRRRESQRRREDELRSQNANLTNTVTELTTRLNAIEQRTTSIDTARIDEEIRGAAYAEQHWKNVAQEAVTKQDGASAIAAMEKMQEAKNYRTQMETAKTAVTQPQGGKQQGIDPRVQANVDSWRAKHAWYDPTKPTRETKLALLIDSEVAQDGFHPATPEFWNELDKRLKDLLPNRYKDVDDDADGDDSEDGTRSNRSDNAGATKSSGTNRRVGAASGGSGSSSTSGSFVLSAERTKAMKDAGVWGDKSKREKMIRTYMEYDKAQKARG